LGGLAILAGMAMHIVLNAVLKEFPPENPAAGELEAYLSRAADGWAVIHGFRYVAFACVVLFAAAMFLRVCRDGAAKGWGVVGLLGAGIWVTNGVIANGIEIVAFHSAPLLVQNEDLFQLIFRLTRVLFTAEVVTWTFAILGFSLAGWLSRRLPRWIAGLGLLQAALGMVSGVSIVSVLSDGWALNLIDAASLAGLLWFVCAGVFLTVRGDSA
jgi:hypothetical protein